MDKECHLVKLEWEEEPPEYCEKDMDTSDIECVCCPQCCTCGG